VPLALASAVLFGLSAPLAKLMIGTIDPWLLAGTLYLGAGLGLGIVHLLRSRLGLEKNEARLNRSDLPWLAGVVLAGGILGPLLLMFGLSMTTASSGSLLLNLEGIVTMAIAWLVFRENVDRRLLLGAGAIMAGAIVLSWNGNGLSLDTGGLLIAAACLCWGIDNNLTRKLSSADPVQIAMIKGLVAGSTNMALALTLGAALPDATMLAAGGVVGFLGVGLSLVFFMLGLRHLGTARTGAYFSLAPFTGALAAIVMFNEPVTPQILVAGLLMALGLWLHLSEKHDHEHAHEALEHEHSHVHDTHHRHDHDGPVIEPHSHWHRHEAMRHKHPHYPDLHHRHSHG
jgi:drug/metabolite transporter (DMT)-like permease